MDGEGRLSIGEVAERTGLTAGALRSWGTRFGFPVEQRLPGGHRRYSETDVKLVGEVLAKRKEGLSLEQAITRVLQDAAPTSPSVFATLRTHHPHLEVTRLRKPTLLAVSWAIEDQVVATADQAMVWGAFQEERFYRAAVPRWRDLAQAAAGVTAFADFEVSDPIATPRKVALPEKAPLRREWTVVVDSPDLPVALSTWELPGQQNVPNRNRVFEAIYTFDPLAVRDAARTCAHIARTIDPLFDTEQYATPPALQPDQARQPSPQRIASTLTRTLAYIDH